MQPTENFETEDIQTYKNLVATQIEAVKSQIQQIASDDLRNQDFKVILARLNQLDKENKIQEHTESSGKLQGDLFSYNVLHNEKYDHVEYLKHIMDYAKPTQPLN